LLFLNFPKTIFKIACNIYRDKSKIYNIMAVLSNKKVAVLTEEGFEQVELTSPVEALKNAGATVHIISPKSGQVKAWDKTDWGITVNVDKELSEVSPDDYDALVLPGGVLNPDKLRQNKDAVAFVSAFLDEAKPLAAICHGPQILIETGMISGRRLTSYPSLQTDLKNAGAQWSDEEVVVDNGLVTSRTPADLPAFNKKIIEEISEGAHIET
jgi:protease I